MAKVIDKFFLKEGLGGRRGTSGSTIDETALVGFDVVVDNLVGPLNEQQSDFIGRAHSRTQKVTHFVKTLLKLTQMRLSNNIEMAVFPVKVTMDDAVAAVKLRATRKSISLKYNIGPEVGEILGNQLAIEEIVTNLLLNAIKYTPEVLKNYDCVLILAAHSGFNYNEIAQKSAIVVDTRNAIKSRKYKKVFHL